MDNQFKYSIVEDIDYTFEEGNIFFPYVVTDSGAILIRVILK